LSDEPKVYDFQDDAERPIKVIIEEPTIGDLLKQQLRSEAEDSVDLELLQKGIKAGREERERLIQERYEKQLADELEHGADRLANRLRKASMLGQYERRVAMAVSYGIDVEISAQPKGQPGEVTRVERRKVRRRYVSMPGAPQKMSDAKLRSAIASAARSVRRLSWANLAQKMSRELLVANERRKQSVKLRKLCKRRLGIDIATLRSIRTRTKSQREFVREIVDYEADICGHRSTGESIKRRV
jgi:hypothetical protein